MNAQTASAAAPDPLTAARADFERVMQRSIKGLGYFTSPAPVTGATPKDTLISRGTMQLHHYRPLVEEVYRVPILLVMATTNRGFIFDLAPGQSFVEFLLKRGYDVFILEWEAPRADEKNLGMDDYVLDFIPSAVARVLQETDETELSVIGYCFGGVLSLLWASLEGQGVLKNLITFTTPVDFHAMEQFQKWSDKRFFDVDRLIANFGNCPPEVLFTAFDNLRPGSTAAAQLRLMDNMWNDEFVKGYRTMERWTTDMLPLAGRYFKETTEQLVWDNALMAGTMQVAGRAVDYGNIKASYLHVAAQHDHIVPTAASEPLVGMIGSEDKDEIVLKGGHVSLVAGPNAVRRLWPQLDTWLQERSL